LSLVNDMDYIEIADALRAGEITVEEAVAIVEAAIRAEIEAENASRGNSCQIFDDIVTTN
jgi:hypothetical protein